MLLIVPPPPVIFTLSFQLCPFRSIHVVCVVLNEDVAEKQMWFTRRLDRGPSSPFVRSNCCPYSLSSVLLASTPSHTHLHPCPCLHHATHHPLSKETRRSRADGPRSQFSPSGTRACSPLLLPFGPPARHPFTFLLHSRISTGVVIFVCVCVCVCVFCLVLSLFYPR